MVFINLKLIRITSIILRKLTLVYIWRWVINVRFLSKCDVLHSAVALRRVGVCVGVGSSTVENNTITKYVMLQGDF